MTEPKQQVKPVQNQPPATPGKINEYEFYELAIDHTIIITYLDGSTIDGTLRGYTKYELLLQITVNPFPVLVCKHAIRSIER